MGSLLGGGGGGRGVRQVAQGPTKQERAAKKERARIGRGGVNRSSNIITGFGTFGAGEGKTKLGM